MHTLRKKTCHVTLAIGDQPATSSCQGLEPRTALRYRGRTTLCRSSAPQICVPQTLKSPLSTTHIGYTLLVLWIRNFWWRKCARFVSLPQRPFCLFFRLLHSTDVEIEMWSPLSICFRWPSRRPGEIGWHGHPWAMLVLSQGSWTHTNLSPQGFSRAKKRKPRVAITFQFQHLWSGEVKKQAKGTPRKRDNMSTFPLTKIPYPQTGDHSGTAKSAPVLRWASPISSSSSFSLHSFFLFTFMDFLRVFLGVENLKQLKSCGSS